MDDQVAWGTGWNDSGRAFTYENGEALRPDFVSSRFETLVAASGLPPVRFHDLRHGAATMLLAAGAELKTVSETLGHASSAFTNDVYAVVPEEMAERAAEVVAAFIPRNESRGIYSAAHDQGQNGDVFMRPEGPLLTSEQARELDDQFFSARPFGLTDLAAPESPRCVWASIAECRLHSIELVKQTSAQLDSQSGLNNFGRWSFHHRARVRKRNAVRRSPLP